LPVLHARLKMGAAMGTVLLLIIVCSCTSVSTATSTSTNALTSTDASTSTTTQPVLTLLPAPADSGEDALWGFIDTNGKWVIKPQFQDAYRFHDGLALVELHGKWGFVNQSATLVIPARFTEAYEFSGGLARVATGPAQDPSQTLKLFLTASGYGFIDKTGKMVIAPTWNDAGDFSEGLAPVMKGESCGYIDTRGRLVIPLKFGLATSFSEGLAAVCGKDGWGYIDKTGAWAIQPVSDNAILSEIGLPDETWQLPVRSFQGGLAPVALDKPATEFPPIGGWRYIDKTGKKAAAGQTFNRAGEFSEGLATVQDSKSEKWGFIDTSGKIVIEPQFEGSVDQYVRSNQGFHQGLAAAGLNGKIGYIDKTGKWVIQPRFAWGHGFSDGFAYVSAPLPVTTSTVAGITFPGPLEIIDLTGRVIYQAPAASGNVSTSSS
jgi:hypothetical protein